MKIIKSNPRFIDDEGMTHQIITEGTNNYVVSEIQHFDPYKKIKHQNTTAKYGPFFTYEKALFSLQHSVKLLKML